LVSERRLLLTLGVVASLAGCVAMQGSGANILAAEQTRISVFDEPWTWTDEEGRAVALSRWRGEPLVIAAVYASCRRTCPYTIEKMRRVDDAFRRKGERAQFVLVTLDPTEDTPDRLRELKEASRMPASWRLLRGDREDTRALMDLLNIHVFDGETHLFHDSKITVFSANGIAARSFACCDFDDDAALL
jgi:protein SCO1/2